MSVVHMTTQTDSYGPRGILSLSRRGVFQNTLARKFHTIKQLAKIKLMWQKSGAGVLTCVKKKRLLPLMSFLEAFLFLISFKS